MKIIQKYLVVASVFFFISLGAMLKVAPKKLHKPALTISSQIPVFRKPILSVSKPKRPQLRLYTQAQKKQPRFQFPYVSRKSFLGYLLGLVGAQWLLSPEEEKIDDDTITINNILDLVENRDPTTAEKIAVFLQSSIDIVKKQHFLDALIQKPYGYYYLSIVLELRPEIAPTLTFLTQQSMSKIYETSEGRIFINKIIEKDTQALDQFARFAQEHLFALSATVSGSQFVTNMIARQPGIAQSIISRMIQSDNISSLRIFNAAIKHAPYDETIATYIKQNYDPHDMLTLLVLYSFNGHQKDLSHKIDIESKTQSLQHIKYNIDHIANSPFIEKIVKTPEIAQLATKVLDQEKKLFSSDNYVFYHGQSREYGFLQELYKLLYQAKYNTEVGKEFIFTNLHRPIMDEKLLQEEENIRKKLIVFDPDDRWKKEVKGHRLFMAAALLGNSTQPDMSPLSYVEKNRGTNEVSLSPRDLFTMFDYQDVYETVKTDVEKLHNEYKSLSPHGQLLQIIVPKAKLTDYVYSAGNKGENKSATIVHDQKLESTTDIQKIMSAFPHNVQSSDNKEFVLVNTVGKNGPLDPSGPFKIFSYDTVSADKREKYSKNQEALFAAINKNIR